MGPDTPERIDIRRLTIEPHLTGVGPFDPAEEITQERLRAAQEILDKFPNLSSALPKSFLLRNIRIVSPDSFSLLETGEIDFEYLYKGFVTDLAHLKLTVDSYVFAATAAVFPEGLKDLSVEPLWDDCKELIYMLSRDWIDHLDFVVDLYPQHLDEVRAGNNPDFMPRLAEKDRREGNWYSYAENMAHARLLFPDYYEANLKPKSTDWRELKKSLLALDAPVAFFEVAKNIKILAAEEVRVCEKGLELVMPQVFRGEEGLNLPEVRRF